MPEILVNDFSTTLGAGGLPAGTGVGGTFALAKALPAAAVGNQVRLRVGSEIVLAAVTTATTMTVVARAAEDADRYPAGDWAAGALVDSVLTAAGLSALIGQTTAGVTSFNTRTGPVTLVAGDVTGALGYSDIARTTQAQAFTVLQTFSAGVSVSSVSSTGTSLTIKTTTSAGIIQFSNGGIGGIQFVGGNTNTNAVLRAAVATVGFGTTGATLNLQGGPGSTVGGGVSAGGDLNLQGGAGNAGGNPGRVVVTAYAGQTSDVLVVQDSSLARQLWIDAAFVLHGSGAGLTGLNAASLSSGTLPDARLSGNVPLLVNGVLPTGVIPAIAISDFLGVVASQAAMLALTGQRGDWCIRSDDSHTYFIVADDPTQPSSWQAVVTPAAPVTSVNNQTGNVVLGPSDLGLGALALLNVVDLSADVTGTLPAGNLPGNLAVKDANNAFSAAQTFPAGVSAPAGTGGGTERIGAGAGAGVTTGANNTLVGAGSGAALTTGAGNTAVGQGITLGAATAGSVVVGQGVTATGANVTVIGTGASSVQTNGGTVVGWGSKATNADGVRHTVVGHGCTASGVGGFPSVVVGDGLTDAGGGVLIGVSLSSTGSNVILGKAITATTASVIAFNTANKAYTPTAGEVFFGHDLDAPRVVAAYSTTTGAFRRVAEVGTVWADPTDATRCGRLTLGVYQVDTLQEGVRVEANAAGVRVGFFGAAAVAKPSGSVVAALGSLGLVGSPAVEESDLPAGVAYTDRDNAFASGQTIGTGADGKAGLEVKQNSGTQSAPLVSLTDSVGNPLTEFDAGGVGFVHSVGWHLAYATDAAPGTNVARGKVRLDYPGQFVKVFMDAEVGPVGADFIIDIKLNGATIWSTTANRAKIAAGGASSVTTAFDTVNFSGGDYLTIDIVQVGSTTPGQDVVVKVTTLMRNR